MAEPVNVVGGSLDTVKQLEKANVTLTHPWAGQGDHKWLPSTIAFCTYAAPQVTGKGETIWQTALTVVTFALMVWGIYEQLKIFMMRYGIAKDYANMATESYLRFVQRYKPLENAMIQEALARTPMAVDYEAARVRQTAFSDWAWGAAQDDYGILAKKYKICPDRSGIWDTYKGLSHDDMVNWGYREAENHAKRMNDLWWNQRAELLNLGRGHSAIGAKFASAANDILAGVGQAASNITTGAFQAFGYLYDRNMLSFPFFFTQSTNPGGLVALPGSAGTGNSSSGSGAGDTFPGGSS
jgi:hypothetical protein